MSPAPAVRSLIGCILLASCSTEPGRDLALSILPAVDTIPANSSAPLRVILVNEDGDSLDVPDVVWSSRDPDVAPISAEGLVSGVRSGEVTIVALAGELRATAKVRVERRFHATDVSTGSSGICAIDLDDRLWCQGGMGSGVAYPTIDSADIRTFITPVNGDAQYALVGSNSNFACGLATGGQLLCWGFWVLGSNLSATVPTQLAPGVTFDTLSVHGWHGCGLAQGVAHCFGAFNYDQRVRTVDTQGSLLVSIDVQENDACGRTADGLQLCWRDYFGVYGDDRSIVQPPGAGVPALTGLVNGRDFFCGLDPSGRAWCWGANEAGQLGNGTTVGSATPVQVQDGLQFTRLAAAAAGDNRLVCGIAETTELFCWGGGFGTRPAALLY